MFSPQNFVPNTSSPEGSYYHFSPGTASTFNSSKSSASNHTVSANSSPGAIYIGKSSPDNPAHRGRSCPVIGSNNGSPHFSSDDGSVKCSYKFDDFQDTSDLQTYVDNFGVDDGFHETMREYCQRPDKKSCEDCQTWSSQYPQESRKDGHRSDYSSDSSSSHGRTPRKTPKRHYSSDSSTGSHHSNHPSKNNSSDDGNSFWMFLVIIILIVLIIWIVVDYRRRYHGGHPLGGMGMKK